MTPDPSLFHGIAVLIDDEVGKDASIQAIQAQIEAEGCHVVLLSKLPNEASIRNLREAAFFVLDWNLYGLAFREAAGGGEVVIPDRIKRQNARDAIQFLKKLKEVRFAPVFIFTDEAVEEVEEQLSKHKELRDENDPSHILVMSKSDVTKQGVFNVLVKWMLDAPSVYVLKEWERAYQSAKNELFIDFYGKSVLWPLFLWKTYQDDDVSPSMELGGLIGRNLLSRMAPFSFELGPFAGALEKLESDGDKSREILLKVLEGDRFLSKERLHGDSISPGDVFKRGPEFFINIRPDCDCIAREGTELDGITLYLLKGDKLSSGQVGKRHDSTYGRINEYDSEAVVFAMNGGTTVSFQLKDLIMGTWAEWKALRIGRLLPPFLTSLQQRYSAYLQRPGLTRVPKAAFPVARSSGQSEEQVPGTASSTQVVAEPAPQQKGPESGQLSDARSASEEEST